MFISIGNANETATPALRALRHAKSDIPAMWMNRLSDAKAPAAASSSKVCRMPRVPTMCAATGAMLRLARLVGLAAGERPT